MAEVQEINSKWSGWCNSHYINPTRVWSLLILVLMVGGTPWSNTIDIDYTYVQWIICSIFMHLIIYAPLDLKTKITIQKLVAGKRPLLFLVWPLFVSIVGHAFCRARWSWSWNPSACRSAGHPKARSISVPSVVKAWSSAKATGWWRSKSKNDGIHKKIRNDTGYA